MQVHSILLWLDCILIILSSMAQPHLLHVLKCSMDSFTSHFFSDHSPELCPFELPEPEPETDLALEDEVVLGGAKLMSKGSIEISPKLMLMSLTACSAVSSVECEDTEWL